jgi:hypothetical protein
MLPKGDTSVAAAKGAVKFCPETSAPLTFTLRLGGVKVYPALLGVMVYAPLDSPLKL